MITNSAQNTYRLHQAPRQRLGNKEAYTSLVPNQNGSLVRYFSSIDAEIYFGDVFIDEMVSIEYKIEQNQLPIFGYNSYIYDDIAIGNRLIVGRFAVNFTKTNYLYEVISTLKAIENGGSGALASVSERSGLWAEESTQTNLKAGFDLYVSFGDGLQSSPGPLSSVTILKNVILTSCSVELSITGEPILEIYEFVARDIDYASNSNTATAALSDTDVDAVVSPIVEDSLQIYKKSASDTLYLSAEIKKDIEITEMSIRYNGSNITQKIVIKGSTIKDLIEATIENVIAKAIFSDINKSGSIQELHIEVNYMYNGDNYEWKDTLPVKYIKQ